VDNTIETVTLHLLFGAGDLSGRDQRQAALCEGAAPEYLSCDDGGATLAVAVGTPSFFGTRTLVARDAELLSKDGIKALVAALPESTATVVLLSAKAKPTAAMKELVTMGELEYFNAPTNADSLVRQLAREAGLTLKGPVLSRLSTVASSDLDLVRSVLEQMKSVGGDVDLDALLDGAGPASTPWVLARCLSQGQVRELFARSEGVDLVGSCAYLAGWATQLAATAEMMSVGSVSAAGVASALGLANERTASGLVESVRALGPVRTDIIVRGLEGIDVTAKLHGSRAARVVLLDVARQVQVSKVRTAATR
jgi:hypothetical protein